MQFEGLAAQFVLTGLQVRVGKWLGELEKNFYGSSMAYDKVDSS